ncbi:MAG: PAS domain S-box protein, partial [Thermodesulfobacteriota bacterium]
MKGFMDFAAEHFPGHEALQHMFWHAPVGIFIATAEGWLVSANPALARMCGFEHPDELFQSYAHLSSHLFVAPQDWEACQKGLQCRDALSDRECTLRRQDGTTFLASLSLHVVRDSHGTIVSYHGFVSEIAKGDGHARWEDEMAAGQTAQKALSMANSVRHFLMDHSRDGIVILDQNHAVLEANQSFADMLGYALPNLRRLHTWDWEALMPEHEIREVFRDLSRIDMCFETRHKRKDGSFYDVEISLRGACVQGQNLVFAICRDISERKDMERRLEQSKQYYRTVFESSGAAQVIIEQDGTIALANSKFAELTGHPREVIEGRKNWTEFVHPEDIAWMRANTQRRRSQYAAPKEYECRCLDRYGGEHTLYVCVAFLPGTEQSMASLVDITERKQAEQRLAHSHYLLWYVIEHANAAVAVHDRDMRYMYVSQSYLQQYNIKEETLIGRHHYEVMPDIPQKWRDIHQRALRGEIIGRDRDPFYRQDGSVKWTRWECRPWYDMDDTIGGFLLYTEDITDRVHNEQAQKEQQELLETLFDSAPLVLLVIDDQRRLRRVNAFAAQLAGRTESEMLGMCAGEAMRCVHANDSDQGCGFGPSCEQCLVARTVLDTLQTGSSKLQIEAPLTLEGDTAGRDLTFMVSSAPVTFQDRRMALLTMQDISDRKAYEQHIQYISLHDQLTGLYNRAYLENELNRLNRSRAHPLTLICMDLDGLKVVNDTLGHNQGDMQLQACARILQEVFRSSDILARIGGDEFVALLPETPLEVGEGILHRIREAVEAFNREQQGKIPLGISIGLACATTQDQDLDTVFKEADDLMYRDKLNRDLNSRSQILTALMAALEERDFMTSGHAHRLETLCDQLGRKAGLSSSQLSGLNLLCQVHDLGKVGIPDTILFKPDRLTDAEWEVMRQHPEKGYRIAQVTTDLAGIADLILKHHERWDGMGYPLGEHGKDIPIECRILAIVDSFDAMTNDRPYRKGCTEAEALQEIQRCAGTQFDPELAELFCAAGGTEAW